MDRDDLKHRRQVMRDKQRIQVSKSLLDDAVFLTIDGVQHELSPLMAKELGEALYKTGADQADKAVA